ncbi:hypothetical protein AGRA3207_003087 [Actinomadura graeca]|uniref:Tetratricopeptide repeat protein n=1 Tax=Actinomadura graeca TaxID=2750812 RepID=A0ABX8QVX2_9ACTN|nr:hypothetical protein [Actinomadura graeca]QXJ22134.1 hypothetical protein AGRA3207_003087 [Actinomadura graeca]
MSTEDVGGLMARSQELPYGEARTILVEDALRRAEAAGDETEAFWVRLQLTNAYQYGGEPAKAFATFSRTMADNDRDPGRFEGTRRLLWQMKAIVNSLTQFPEIPLDRTHRVLDDMERRYREAGYSLQAVYHYRNAVALHVGDASADDWYLKWRAAPRDELSDCAGCDPTSMVEHLVRYGRYEEAFEVAAPVLGEELNCAEQPQGIQTALLPVYLRTGRTEEARDAHRRAYRVHRTQLADLDEIADHLRFCADTGNEARALEIVQRHLGWLDRAPSPHIGMRFAAAASLVLRRLTDAGHGAATVRRPGFGDRAAADVPLAELGADLAGVATGLAERFDARNGTSCQGDLIRAILEAEPIVEFLPLGEHHRRRRAPSPAPAPEAADLSSETDLDALLDEADRRRLRRDMPGAAARWRRFDEVAETTEPTPMQRARRVDGQGGLLAFQGDFAGAIVCWEEAAGLFAGLGEQTRRYRTLSRLGAARVQARDRGPAQPGAVEPGAVETGAVETGAVESGGGGADVVTGLAELEAAADHFAAHPTGDGDGTIALVRLARAFLDLGRPADAGAALDRIAPDDSPGDAGEVAFLRGSALLMAGDVGEAVAVLRAGVAAAREAGDPEPMARPALLLSQTLNQLAHAEGPDAPPAGEDPGAEVLAVLGEVIETLPGPSPLLTAAHAERGLTLLVGDRPAEAVADLAEAVAGWTAAGLHEQATYLRVDLAAGYLAAGRHLEAAEVAEEALPAVAEDAERRCRLVLAHAQKELGEEDAAGLFASLAEDAAKDGQHGAAGHFLEQSAEVLTNLDKDAVAAGRFADAADAYAEAPDPHGVVRTRRRAAMCLLWSGETPGAVTAMETAREALAGLPPGDEPARIWETALVSFDQARVLAQAGRLADAETHAAAAVDGFRVLEETGPAEEATALLNDIRSAMG